MRKTFRTVLEMIAMTEICPTILRTAIFCGALLMSVSLGASFAVAGACKLAEHGSGACDLDGSSCFPPPAGTCWTKSYPAGGPGPPGHPEWLYLCSCLASPPPPGQPSNTGPHIDIGIGIGIGGHSGRRESHSHHGKDHKDHGEKSDEHSDDEHSDKEKSDHETDDEKPPKSGGCGPH